jgi:hypothetical protein
MKTKYKEESMKETVKQEVQEKLDSKLEYSPPKLQEHGNVEEVTLQTFFGTFSPPPSKGG